MVAVNAPLNAIVPVVFVNVTVVALTAPLNVVPPEFVIVKVVTPDMVDPAISAPATPPVVSVNVFDPPVTAPMVKSATLVVAFVFRLTALPRVMAPKVIALFVELIVPFTVTVLGAVAVIPPVKAKVPPLAPNPNVPVLLKVTAFVIVPVVAFKPTL